MARSAYNTFNTRSTPQSQPVPGLDMVKNNAGGYAFQANDWTRLHRFLILGTSGGSYYVNSTQLTKENAEVVLRCISNDGKRVVDEIVRVSDQGLAPNNDPALFALALVASFGNEDARKYALNALPRVARIPTHLFHFVQFTQQFRGWGRGLRKAVGRWYTSKNEQDLGYQLTKYQQRDGWSNADLLRLSHPSDATPNQSIVFRWAMGKELGDEEYATIRPLEGFYRIQHADNPKVAASLIEEYRLPREVVPTQFLNSPEVWDALLASMPMGAMVRNLGKMTSVGLIETNLSEAANFIASKLVYKDGLRKSRIHPMALLVALRTYQQGHGEKGSLKWTPVRKIVDALDEAFYMSFDNVTPTGKKLLVAVDESGSMANGAMSVPMRPYEAALAQAMIFVRTEPNVELIGFDTHYRALDISPRQRLDDILNRRANGGGTNCALPFAYAIDKHLKLDGILIITDAESWQGSEHVFQSADQYRIIGDASAKFVYVQMTAQHTQLNRPNDTQSLEVVGFDASIPTLTSEFLAGNV